MSDELDLKIGKLSEKLAAEEAEVDAYEKKPFVTNCVVPLRDGIKANIHTFGTVKQYVDLAAELLALSERHKQAAELLSVDYEFKPGGHTLEEWIEDIKSSLEYHQIRVKKKNISAMKSKLEKLLSEGARRSKELGKLESEIENL